MKIIDFHIHSPTLLFKSNKENISGKEQAAAMRRYGVERGVISAGDALMSNCHDFKAAHDNLVEYVRGEEDTFCLYCTINPLDGQKGLDEMQRCNDRLGFRGLKLHPWLQGTSVSESFMDAIVEKCVELDWPIIFHDGTPPYCTPFQIADLCRRFPSSRIVSGHAGLNDLWQNAIHAAQQYSNFHICMCGPSMLAMERIERETPIEQIVFGTDMIGSNDGCLSYRVDKIQKLSVTDADRKKIVWDNALRLLGEA